MTHTRRLRSVALLTALTTASVACERSFFHEPAEPAAAVLVLDLSEMSSGAGPAGAFDKAELAVIRILDRDRVRHERALPLTSTGQDVQVSLEVPLTRATETLTLSIELRFGDAPIFAGSSPIQLRVGATTALPLALEPVPHALELDDAQPTLTAYGDSVIAEGAVLFATGDTLSLNGVEWTSLDTDVVVIDGGVPIARDDGDARLVGRAGTLADTITVRVFAEVRSIAIVPATVELPVGDSHQYTAELFDRRGNRIASSRPITWASSAPGVVAVTAAGLATALDIGPAEISVFSGDAVSKLEVRTLPGQPLVMTDSATAITKTSADLQATIDPRGAPAEVWFEYSTDSTFTTKSVTLPVVIPASLQPIQVSVRVLQLVRGTTYYVRAFVRSEPGTAQGDVYRFTTLWAELQVTTGDAENVSQTEATALAIINPDGASATAWFEWSTDPAFANANKSQPQSIPPFVSNIPISGLLHGLTPGKAHYYRAVATYDSTLVYGEIRTFFTAPGPSATVPVVITLAATPIRSDSAVVNASVNAAGLATTAWFEWGTDAGLSTFASTPAQSVGSGSTAVSVSRLLLPLTPGTTYYFRAAASNAGGTVKGTILSFTTTTTGVTLPLVFTGPAAPVQGDTAVVSGSVNPNGQATDFWFEWGTDPLLANFAVTSVRSFGGGFGEVPVAELMSSLTTGVTYYYRVVATNPGGTVRGTIQSFTAMDSPVLSPPSAETLPVSDRGSYSATLNGSVNPNGSITAVWFEYGTRPMASTYTTSAVQVIGSGSSPTPVSLAVSDLTRDTPYWYRIVALNQDGTTYGAVVEFETREAR